MGNNADILTALERIAMLNKREQRIKNCMDNKSVGRATAEQLVDDSTRFWDRKRRRENW